MTRRICTRHGCRRTVRARGMCNNHYKRSGALGVCTIDGCEGFVVARDWCSKHYQRWQKHGHPEATATQRAPRRDTAGHGTRRMYDLGCRCLPCAVENTRYQTDRNQGRLRRIPAAEVVAHVDQLVASGWTKLEIAAEANLGNSTLASIRRQRWVNSRTADAILALEPLREVRLDPGPLFAVLALREVPLTSLPEARSRALYRARKAGWISDALADQIAIDVLGMTLEEIYGPDWDEVAA